MAIKAAKRRELDEILERSRQQTIAARPRMALDGIVPRQMPRQMRPAAERALDPGLAGSERLQARTQTEWDSFGIGDLNQDEINQLAQGDPLQDVTANDPFRGFGETGGRVGPLPLGALRLAAQDQRRPPMQPDPLGEPTNYPMRTLTDPLPDVDEAARRVAARNANPMGLPFEIGSQFAESLADPQVRDRYAQTPQDVGAWAGEMGDLLGVDQAGEDIGAWFTNARRDPGAAVRSAGQGAAAFGGDVLQGVGGIANDPTGALDRAGERLGGFAGAVGEAAGAAGEMAPDFFWGMDPYGNARRFDQAQMGLAQARAAGDQDAIDSNVTAMRDESAWGLANTAFPLLDVGPLASGVGRAARTASEVGEVSRATRLPENAPRTQFEGLPAGERSAPIEVEATLVDPLANVERMDDGRVRMGAGERPAFTERAMLHDVNERGAHGYHFNADNGSRFGVEIDQPANMPDSAFVQFRDQARAGANPLAVYEDDYARTGGRSEEAAVQNLERVMAAVEEHAGVNAPQHIYMPPADEGLWLIYKRMAGYNPATRSIDPARVRIEPPPGYRVIIDEENRRIILERTADAPPPRASRAQELGQGREVPEAMADMPLLGTALTAGAATGAGIDYLSDGDFDFGEEAAAAALVGVGGLRGKGPRGRLTAAIRDPDTGRVFTGANHAEAIGSAPRNVQARLEATYAENGANVGFQSADGVFMDRDAALASLGDAAFGRRHAPAESTYSVNGNAPLQNVDAAGTKQPHRTFTENEVNTVIRLTEEGVNPTEIARQLGSRRNQVIAALDRAGVSEARGVPGFAAQNAERDAQWLARLERGESQSTIAAAEGVGVGAVAGAVRRARKRAAESGAPKPQTNSEANVGIDTERRARLGIPSIAVRRNSDPLTGIALGTGVGGGAVGLDYLDDGEIGPEGLAAAALFGVGARNLGRVGERVSGPTSVSSGMPPGGGRPRSPAVQRLAELPSGSDFMLTGDMHWLGKTGRFERTGIGDGTDFRIARVFDDASQAEAYAGPRADEVMAVTTSPDGRTMVVLKNVDDFEDEGMATMTDADGNTITGSPESVGEVFDRGGINRALEPPDAPAPKPARTPRRKPGDVLNNIALGGLVGAGGYALLSDEAGAEEGGQALEDGRAIETLPEGVDLREGEFMEPWRKTRLSDGSEALTRTITTEDGRVFNLIAVQNEDASIDVLGYVRPEPTQGGSHTPIGGGGEGNPPTDWSLDPAEPQIRPYVEEGARLDPLQRVGAAALSGLVMRGLVPRGAPIMRSIAAGSGALVADAATGGDPVEAFGLAAGGVAGSRLMSDLGPIASRAIERNDLRVARERTLEQAAVGPEFEARRDAFAATLSPEPPRTRNIEANQANALDGRFLIPRDEVVEQGFATERVGTQASPREQFLRVSPAEQLEWMDHPSFGAPLRGVDSGTIGVTRGPTRPTPAPPTPDPIAGGNPFYDASGKPVFGSRPRKPAAQRPPLAERAATGGTAGAMQGVSVRTLREIADDLDIETQGVKAVELRRSLIRNLADRFDSTRELVSFLARYGVPATALGFLAHDQLDPLAGVAR